ncbi:MAG: ORF6N domain-containing protein [Muribaculaceae bacterium]|nr:ORF6N domain-containing protein [Muribaculaceae bacterium]
MNKLIPAQIKTHIYEIRDQKVILDRDLAEMYGVETRVLNQAVKRNIERFPADFMFRLTKEETDIWKSQIVISNSVNKGLRKMPYAFTELGVAMLSSVLSSPTAIQVNISIMRAFVAVRQSVSRISDTDTRLSILEQNFNDLKSDLEEIFSDYNDINEDTRLQLEIINESLAEMNRDKSVFLSKRRKIGFIETERDDDRRR